MVSRLPFDVDRSRLGWWLVAVALGAAFAFVLYSFVGTFVLALFIYYGARPMHRRLQRRIDSPGATATLTLLLIVLPTLALLGYAVGVAFQEFTATVGPDLTGTVVDRLPFDPESVTALTSEPRRALAEADTLRELQGEITAGLQTLGAVTNGLFHLTVALGLAFFLFRDGDRLAAWFRADVSDRDGVAYAYLSAVDADLEAVYFGNVLTVLLVTVLSLVVYNAFAFVSPPGVGIPAPTLLAVLTGVATFIPLVVGKVVYVPVALFLAWRAVSTAPNRLWFPVVFLAVAFLLLDILPQTFLRPYIAGRTLHTGLVLFAYILGAALFGWYGLFLGPLLLVLLVQFVNLVFPELLHGLPITPRPSRATSLGSDPKVDLPAAEGGSDGSRGGADVSDGDRTETAGGSERQPDSADDASDG
ncbi:AI-2E family transporter [Halegenticoccus tardaugens]|uniref:AI-2E family transporter n=1 Tax=Halegenticoccus tardaugens TaxID=2071624 RepID=UPI00100A861D|nr:AI-2E family transporter [Halegenticoccus tardaugens]